MRNGVFEKAYNIIDKGRLRRYIYTIYSNEVIDSILGKVNAIVIKRSIENNKRSFRRSLPSPARCQSSAGSPQIVGTSNL